MVVVIKDTEEINSHGDKYYITIKSGRGDTKNRFTL